MTNSFSRILIGLALLSLLGCGLFRDKKSNSDADASSSSGLTSSSSSSSDTDRVEISYADTLFVRDSLAYKLVDSMAENGVWNLFLGKFPQGTLLHLALHCGNLDANTKFRIRSEKGVIQLPTDTLPTGGYRNYSVCSDTAFLVNHFALRDTAYYYLEVQGEHRVGVLPSDTLPDFRASLNIDTAYYQFTGKEGSAQLPANGRLEGFFRLDAGEDSVEFSFGAAGGYNLTLNTSGQSLEHVILKDQSGITIDSAISTLRSQLLPQDSSQWHLWIRSVIPSYYSGNYAFFILDLRSLKLGKGEYFAYPDSIVRAGDTLSVDHKGTENSGWDVRHDHYVWLGDLAAGETIRVWQSAQGMLNVKKSMRILDAQGNPVDSFTALTSNNWIAETPATFVATKAGPYYAQYTGIGTNNTYWTDPNYTLHARTLLQRDGSVKSWAITPKTIILKAGGPAWYMDSAFAFTGVDPSNASKNHIYLLARDSARTYLRDSVDIAYAKQGTGSPADPLVRSGYLVPISVADSKKLTTPLPLTARLQIQSVADPTKMEECLVTIEP